MPGTTCRFSTVVRLAPNRCAKRGRASQQFQPPGFSLPLGQKDNRLMLAAAEALGVPLPLASLVHDRFLTLRSQGLGAEHDWSAVALFAPSDAGLSNALHGG